NHSAATGDITFQVRLFETSNKIQFKYQDVFFAGSQTIYDQGLSATVGLEGPLPAPRPFTLYSFNTASLTNGQCIEFTQPQGCSPVPGPTQTVSTDPTSCTATATIAIPASNPTGCIGNQANGLRYRVGNTGPFTNVMLPAASVTIPGLTAGPHVITWQVYLLSNGATIGSAT